jgi:hypothetical protein
MNLHTSILENTRYIHTCRVGGDQDSDKQRRWKHRSKASHGRHRLLRPWATLLLSRRPELPYSLCFDHVIYTSAVYNKAPVAPLFILAQLNAWNYSALHNVWKLGNLSNFWAVTYQIYFHRIYVSRKKDSGIHFSRFCSSMIDASPIWKHKHGSNIFGMWHLWNFQFGDCYFKKETLSLLVPWNFYSQKHSILGDTSKLETVKHIIQASKKKHSTWRFGTSDLEKRLRMRHLKCGDAKG